MDTEWLLVGANGVVRGMIHDMGEDLAMAYNRTRADNGISVRYEQYDSARHGSREQIASQFGDEN